MNNTYSGCVDSNEEFEDFGEYKKNTASSSKRTKHVRNNEEKYVKENVKADMKDNESYIDTIIDNVNCRIKYNDEYIDKIKFYKTIDGELVLHKIMVRMDNIMFWTVKGEYSVTEYDCINGCKMTKSEFSNRIMIYNESYYSSGIMKSKCYYDSITGGLTHGIWYNIFGFKVKEFDREEDDDYDDDVN